MATDRTFQDMLNDYLPNELLKEELVKRDYVLKMCERDDSWKSGPLIVPFKAAGASSVKFGGLTASNDVGQDKYVRGEVTAPKEIWGTMLFNHRDIMEHDKVSEQNFLKLLPETTEDFIQYVKDTLSVNLLNGAHFATLTADASANDGLVTVDRPDRFTIDQKVIVDDTDVNPSTGYVSAIDINTKVVTLVTTRGGSTVVDFSVNTQTTAKTAKCYNDGADTSTNVFSSMRDALLSSTNGGSAALYGETKTDYPYLQAINVDGSAVTATNIMEKIFDALTDCRQYGKGNPTDVVMSYKNLGSCMKILESSKGAFNVQPGSQKTSQYGWTEIAVFSVTKGSLKLVGVQEADDDVIMIVDWRGMKFSSNGFFTKRKGPNGNEYFEVRSTSGYQYLVDICCFGEFTVNRPSYSGIIYSISY